MLNSWQQLRISEKNTVYYHVQEAENSINIKRMTDEKDQIVNDCLSKQNSIFSCHKNAV